MSEFSLEASKLPLHLIVRKIQLFQSNSALFDL